MCGFANGVVGVDVRRDLVEYLASVNQALFWNRAKETLRRKGRLLREGEISRFGRDHR
jgi:hypothetical protein